MVSITKIAAGVFIGLLLFSLLSYAVLSMALTRYEGELRSFEASRTYQQTLEQCRELGLKCD